MTYLNASIIYFFVDTWGYYNETTKQWSGMIGNLVNNEAELGASPLFFTTDRIDVIEYIAMTSATRSKFVFRSPKLSYTDNVFILPFDKFVWFSMAGMIIVSVIILSFATLMEWKLPLRTMVGLL